uniref:BRCT domain-containing protein n=1 Tax=Aegilops tauschii subsp. strangulata TaxID=200361 RepID=A0A453N783_AEGTS
MQHHSSSNELGEKYKCAERLGIKIVNHRWLEDCLKSWKILPEDDYSESGWELEIVEAQAKERLKFPIRDRQVRKWEVCRE